MGGMPGGWWVALATSVTRPPVQRWSPTASPREEGSAISCNLVLMNNALKMEISRVISKVLGFATRKCNNKPTSKEDKAAGSETAEGEVTWWCKSQLPHGP